VEAAPTKVRAAAVADPTKMAGAAVATAAEVSAATEMATTPAGMPSAMTATAARQRRAWGHEDRKGSSERKRSPSGHDDAFACKA
jgi:hypothetical protein